MSNKDRLRLKEARKLKKKGRGAFIEIDLLKTEAPVPPWMTRSFKNNYYMVMINVEPTKVWQ